MGVDLQQKKKKRSMPVSLHLFYDFRPKHVTKCAAKQVMTFFFLVVIPFFALPDMVTLYLEVIESKRIRKYKNIYSIFPKSMHLYKQGGPVPHRTPHFLRL